MNVLAILAWLVAAGVTQPLGVNTTIYVHDTSASASGLGYTFAEISAAFPTDFVLTNPGDARPVYSTITGVSVQIGDETVDATSTELKDTNATVLFTANTGLIMRTTQTSSWTLTLGTKIGSGSTASGKAGCSIHYGSLLTPVLRGTVKLYDTQIISNTFNTINLNALSSDNNGSELYGCEFFQPSTGSFTVGSSTNRWSNIYDCRFSTGATGAVTGALWAVNMDRNDYSASAPSSFFAASTANIVHSGVSFYGAPSQSSYRWTSTAATNWSLDRPGWAQSGAKFTQSVAGSIAVANGAKESRRYNVKVSLAGGTAKAGIPVKLTDATGAVQVDTTTDANGRISFSSVIGSATVPNGVIVMDHYTVSQVYTQRHRSPFLVEVNAAGATAPRNTSYGSYRYYLYWPGYEGVTTSAGTFEDVNDVIPLEFAAGPGGVTWIEDVAS